MTGGAAARSAARRSSRVSARYQPACANGAGSRAIGVASRPSRSLGACHACMMSLGVMGVPPCACDKGTTRSAPAPVRGLATAPRPIPAVAGDRRRRGAAEPLTAAAGRPARDCRHRRWCTWCRSLCRGAEPRSEARLDAEALVGPRRVQRRLRQLDGAGGMGRELRPLGGGQARPVVGVFPGANDVARGHGGSSFRLDTPLTGSGRASCQRLAP